MGLVNLPDLSQVYVLFSIRVILYLGMLYCFLSNFTLVYASASTVCSIFQWIYSHRGEYTLYSPLSTPEVLYCFLSNFTLAYASESGSPLSLRQGVLFRCLLFGEKPQNKFKLLELIYVLHVSQTRSSFSSVSPSGRAFR